MANVTITATNLKVATNDNYVAVDGTVQESYTVLTFHKFSTVHSVTHIKLNSGSTNFNTMLTAEYGSGGNRNFSSSAHPNYIATNWSSMDPNDRITNLETMFPVASKTTIMNDSIDDDGLQVARVSYDATRDAIIIASWGDNVSGTLGPNSIQIKVDTDATFDFYQATPVTNDSTSMFNGTSVSIQTIS